MQQRGVVRLDDEEETFLERDLEKGRASDRVGRVAPYSLANQVRVPRDGGGKGDSNQKGDFVEVELGKEGSIE